MVPASASATTAPPTPAPKAVPSVNMSCSAEELNPSSPGTAVSSTMSASIEYARPIPSPATAQPSAATRTGISGTSTSAVMTIPAPIRPAPLVTKVRLMPAAAARAWTHDPMVQVTAAADNAMPPSVTLPPRTSTTVSGTNASVPKKANAMPNTTATTAGRPRRRRSVPGGSRWRSAATANQPPATASRNASGTFPIVRAASNKVEPSARRTASKARRASLRIGTELRCAAPRRASCG